MTDGTLVSIHIHPIKSCRRVDVQSARVASYGLEGDRTWEVIDTDGKPLTQRQHPVLATVQPELLADGALRITAAGRQPLEIGGPERGAAVTARTLFNVGVEAMDAGDEAAAWFTELLGVPARMAGAGEARWRRLPERFDYWGQPLSFADASPVLVTNTASLDWLVARSAEAFGMDRFRPNLVIETSAAWVEDTWDEFHLGDTRLHHGLPWPRCAIPQIDQNTAERRAEPARVLRAHRWCVAAPAAPEAFRPIIVGNGLFGIGCAIDSAPGEATHVLTVGSSLTVDTVREPILAAPAGVQ